MNKTKKAMRALRSVGELVTNDNGTNELHLPMGVKTGVFDDDNEIITPISEKSINIKLNGKKI